MRVTAGARKTQRVLRRTPNRQTLIGKRMSVRELKKISSTYGFEVASHNTRSERRSIVYNKIDTPPPPPPPQTPQIVKKKKRPNPYAGASGPYSRKARWSKAKKPRQLDLDDVKTTEEESASDASLALGDPLVGC